MDDSGLPSPWLSSRTADEVGAARQLGRSGIQFLHNHPVARWVPALRAVACFRGRQLLGRDDNESYRLINTLGELIVGEPLPNHSCDTHLHVFGAASQYPVANPRPLYQPPEDCNFDALGRLHAALGIQRAVLVQPTIYGTDHRLLYDVLKSAPAGRYRGVAIVDDSVEDAELRRLDKVGVRCARFNFSGRFNLAPSVKTFRRTLERIGALGWSAKIFGFGDDFLPVADELRRIEIPAIIDHMGGLDYSRGISQPAVRLILQLLERENWWIGLSNGDLRSQRGEPWDDAVEFGRLFYAAAPTRCMWGTDWPHVHRFIRPHEAGESDYGIVHEQKRIALLERYLPDRTARDCVLADNAARFFRF